MAFTDHCDVYGAIHETGINRVVRHIMRQRPSLFNYGTLLVQQNPELLCVPIDPEPEVIEHGNPLLTVEDPLPIFGTIYGLNYCFQFTKFEIDFFPGNSITLPGELNPPLADQRFALHGQVCAGLGCPDQRTLGDITRMADQLQRSSYFSGAQLTAADLSAEQTYVASRGRLAQSSDREAGLMDREGRQIARPEVKRPLIPLPARKLLCFCLDLYVVGHFNVEGPAGRETIQPWVDGIDIQDIKPDNMEDSLLCYVMLLLQLGILPKAKVAIPTLVLDTLPFISLTISATPISAAVPHNPAIEDDQVKVLIDLSVGPPGPPPPPPPPPPPAPPPHDWNWSSPGPTDPGPDHLTVAASKKAVVNLFSGVRDGFVFSKSFSGNFGPFSAGADVAFHLEDGALDLRNDGTISVKGLDIKWDQLDAWLGIDIPGFCVGGFCIIPNPFDGCAVRAPKICIFGDDPDFTVKLDLSGFITSEVSMALSLLTKYGIDKARPGGLSDVDALIAGFPNKWGVFMDPEWVNIDLFDIADMVGDLLMNAITAAITNLLPGPKWAKDAVLHVLGSIVDLIRSILGIPHKVIDWLSDLLGVSLGLFNWIVQIILEHFSKNSPLIKLDDPFPASKAPPLIPITIPVRSLAVGVNASEMTLLAKVGA